MEQKPIKELKQQAQTDEQLQIKYERLTLDTKVNFFTKTEK